MDDKDDKVIAMGDLEAAMDQIEQSEKAIEIFEAAQEQIKQAEPAMKIYEAAQEQIDKYEQAKASLRNAQYANLRRIFTTNETGQPALVQTDFNQTEMRIMAQFAKEQEEERKAYEKSVNERAIRLYNEIVLEGHEGLPSVSEKGYDLRLLGIVKNAIMEEDLAQQRAEEDDMGPDPTEPDDDPLPSPWHLSSPRKRVINVGRNDPCPCGSGKKFKKCCWGQMAIYEDGV